MKKNLFLFSLILFLSCNDSKKTSVKSISENEKLIKTYFEHFNNHDWEKMAAMYVENASFKDPSLGNGIVKLSQKQIKEKYSDLNKIFSNLHDEVIAIYPSGENVIIVEFISSGTAPDNSKFEMPICTIFTFENGKIIKDYTYCDNFEE